MRLATIDGEALSKALRLMARAPREMLGSAFWCFGDELVIRWTTYEEPLDAQIESTLEAPLMVPGDAMAQLCARVELRGDVPLEWDPEGTRLVLGPHRLPATPSEPPFQLALDARPRDLLPHLLVRPETLAPAGYAAEAAALRKRWDGSLAAAAEALAWTGLGVGALEAVLVAAIDSPGR